jgi:hypothetical protein
VDLLFFPQLPVADGVVQGRDLVVKVQWEPDHTDVTPVLAVGTRLWKEDAGPIPPRSGSYDSESKQVMQAHPPDVMWTCLKEHNNFVRYSGAAWGI